eukprot:gene5376-4129_t
MQRGNAGPAELKKREEEEDVEHNVRQGIEVEAGKDRLRMEMDAEDAEMDIFAKPLSPPALKAEPPRAGGGERHAREESSSPSLAQVAGRIGRKPFDMLSPGTREAEQKEERRKGIKLSEEREKRRSQSQQQRKKTRGRLLDATRKAESNEAEHVVAGEQGGGALEGLPAAWTVGERVWVLWQEDGEEPKFKEGKIYQVSKSGQSV